MKIQYMSNLHTELADNSRNLKNVKFPVTGDILVLAEDTFYLNNTTAPLAKFWKWASVNYRQVLLVPGNHEYYQRCDVMTRGLQWRWMFKENGLRTLSQKNNIVRLKELDYEFLRLSLRRKRRSRLSTHGAQEIPRTIPNLCTSVARSNLAAVTSLIQTSLISLPTPSRDFASKTCINY